MNSRWTDVQEMYDKTPVEDKKIFYVGKLPGDFMDTHISQNIPSK